MDPFIMQLLMDVWAARAPFVLLRDLHHPFGNLAIFLFPR
jgi:hypothetical protein